MNRAMLRQYTKLVEFLGLTLGPSYEITLHDINGKNSTIVAIVNGSISGRDLDSPPTTMAMKAIADNAAGRDYRINYNGLASGNKVLRSSTYYIKDNGGNLVGMLCINFDDSQFQDITRQLFLLIHPDNYVENNILVRQDVLEEAALGEDTERFNGSVLSAADAVIQETLAEDGVPVDRLTQAEKIRIVARLEERGIFRLKGAVEHVSQTLSSSPASIYRYLSKVRKEKAK
ncbi:MAG: PAS domain-containing protein [Clostridiales bacterium]|nr:PAS domain-containing protein [Clostridiales bacterium]